MVDEVDTSKVLEELSRSNAGASSNSSPRQKRGRLGSLFTGLLLVVLLAGAALLGYQQWTLYLRLNSLATQNNQLLESVQASDERLAQLEADPSPDTTTVDMAAVDSLRDEFETRLAQINQVVGELRQRAVSSPIEDDSNLQLAEAEHLLRIANRHLQLTDDVKTTISLLESADRLLLEADDSRATPVREALAREMMQLRSLQEVDIDGLYLRLAAVRELIENMEIAPVGTSYQQQLARSREQAAADTDETPESLLDSGLDFFSEIFVWREWEEAPEIEPPSLDIVLLRQSIDLLIEQAQVALLTRRPEVYEQNLREAREQIARYGESTDQTISQILTQLDGLLAETLAPQLPDISQSLFLLRQVDSRPSVDETNQ